MDAAEYIFEVQLDEVLDGGHSPDTPIQSIPTNDVNSQPFSPDTPDVPPEDIPIPNEDVYEFTDSDSVSENYDYYDIEADSDEENDNLPSYPLTNIEMTDFDQDDPSLLVLEQEDQFNGWEYQRIDTGPSYGPFLSSSRTPIEDVHGKPEVFFNELFDDHMWTIIADETNTKARSKSTTPQGNRCTDPTNIHYKKHCRLNTWTDVTPSDIKLFMAHNIIMGLVKKPDLEKYWNSNTPTRIPFFGKFMSRNRFQSILSNFHVGDDSNNPPLHHPNHDPLAKVRPFLEMIDRNFLYAYKPSKALSFDEACCPFKGRLRFRCFNPMKPNRFHIKLFQVSESSSGYILGCHIYTGKDTLCVSHKSTPLDPNVTKTTKIVLGLLQKCQLLDVGHHIYMDNYYSSPELSNELYYRSTYSCGTVRASRKEMPKTLAKAKLKPLQSVFLRNGPLLCMKWLGPKSKSKKKPVTMLSTIHEATELLTQKKDRHGNRLPKPVCIYDYTKNMAGVDISDQYMAFHTNLRKSMKWSRKLFFHLFNMLLLNAYIINKKFGKKKLSKEEYYEYIAKDRKSVV